MPCTKQKRHYRVCKHDAAPIFIFCDEGEHEDNPTKNEACYDNATKRKKTTILTPIDEDYCSKDCEAEFDRWCCCICDTWVIGPRDRNDNNDLFHERIEVFTPEDSDEPVEHIVEHIYCPGCKVPSGRED